MSEKELSRAIHGLPLPEVRFYHETGSTNQDALNWAAQGAPDLALIVADHQTAGRGRLAWIGTASGACGGGADGTRERGAGPSTLRFDRRVSAQD